MQAGEPPGIEQIVSLLSEYEATGRNPADDGISTDMQVPPAAR